MYAVEGGHGEGRLRAGKWLLACIWQLASGGLHLPPTRQLSLPSTRPFATFSSSSAGLAPTVYSAPAFPASCIFRSSNASLAPCSCFAAQVPAWRRLHQLLRVPIRHPQVHQRLLQGKGCEECCPFCPLSAGWQLQNVQKMQRRGWVKRAAGANDCARYVMSQCPGLQPERMQCMHQIGLRLLTTLDSHEGVNLIKLEWKESGPTGIVHCAGCAALRCPPTAGALQSRRSI